MEITPFEYPDMTAAWKGIHDYMFNHEDEVKARGGTTYGSEFASYNNLIHIKDCTFDQEFDFGRVLGYKLKKWSKLINNYFDPNYLDLIKNEVIEREIKRSNNYNYSYRFDNSHGSGKDCLISLTFSRRKTTKSPVVIFHTRASEVTKRLAFDFLLIQRMVEYVYGVGTKVELICYIPFMFVNLECSLMYVAEYGTKVVKKKEGAYTKYQQKILDKYKFFQEVDTDTIKYKVHQRAARQVQRTEDGKPLADCPPLLAKEMDLNSSAKYAKNEPGKERKVKGERGPSVDIKAIYLEFKTMINKTKPDAETLSKAALAFTTGNTIFYPKTWDEKFLTTFRKPKHKKWLTRTVRLIMIKSSK